jgi:hypothetical protein
VGYASGLRAAAIRAAESALGAVTPSVIPAVMPMVSPPPSRGNLTVMSAVMINCAYLH